MNLDEIRAMNPNEARKLPVEELIRAIYEGETYPVTNLVKDKFGNNIEQTNEAYAKLDGNLISRHMVTWTYHDAKVGNVKDITTEEFYEEGSPKSVLVTRQDEAGKEQPVVVKRQAFAKPIAKPIER